MPAKPTAKNRIAPPKPLADNNALAEARRKFKEKGFDEETIAQAVKWAKKKRSK